jgi:hypothetical protein
MHQYLSVSGFTLLRKFQQFQRMTYLYWYVETWRYAMVVP